MYTFILLFSAQFNKKLFKSTLWVSCILGIFLSLSNLMHVGFVFNEKKMCPLFVSLNLPLCGRGLSRCARAVGGAVGGAVWIHKAQILAG